MNEQLAALRPLFNRKPDSHKYNFGHVLVIGGAPGMVGAPWLAARAALRSGAGLVTVAAAANVIDKLEKRTEEIMTLRLPATTANALKTLQSFIEKRRVSVLAIGPGLDVSRTELVKQLLEAVFLPTVLDAGALAAYDGREADLRQLTQQNSHLILTPHHGEFARLIGRPLPSSAAAIQRIVTDYARATGTTVLLKSHRTLVASPDGRTYRNQNGNAGLATAGTGDVLTGLIAGLEAQHLDTYQAACGAAYLHGLAGDLAAGVKTEPGLIASDVIEAIPAALQQVKNELSAQAYG